MCSLRDSIPSEEVNNHMFLINRLSREARAFFAVVVAVSVALSPLTAMPVWAAAGNIEQEDVDFDPDGETSTPTNATPTNAETDDVSTPTNADKGIFDFEKIDENGDPVSGARLMIVCLDNEMEASWITDGTVHRIELEAGDYVLSEEDTPDGYECAEDIYFTVTLEGKRADFADVSDHAVVRHVSVEGRDEGIYSSGVVIEDAEIDYDEEERAENPEKIWVCEFIKRDQNGREIPLNGDYILEKCGDVIAEWRESRKVLMLEPGEYVFRERSAPEGYKRVADYSFELSGGSEDDFLEMEDTVVESETKDVEVSFLKQDDEGEGDSLEGAVLRVLDSEGWSYGTWTTGPAAKILKLPEGDYSLKVLAAPPGYIAGGSLDFSVTLVDPLPEGTVALQNSFGLTDKGTMMINMVDPKKAGVMSISATAERVEAQSLRIVVTDEEEDTYTVPKLSIIDKKTTPESPSTPSDATPSDATPSDPEKPDEPDTPSTPSNATPSNPDRPEEKKEPDTPRPQEPTEPADPPKRVRRSGGSGGRSSGGSDTTNGASDDSHGSESNTWYEPDSQVTPDPGSPEKPERLPETGDGPWIPAALFSAVLSAMVLVFIDRRKKSGSK